MIHLLPSLRKAFTAGALAAGMLCAWALLGAQAAPQRAVPTVVGLWEQVDDDGSVGSWFYIYERNGIYMGDIVKMFLKPGEKPNPICTKCPGEQKNQPTLGLTLIKGMQRKGRNYENGTILDPRDGSIYSARMELSPDGQKLMVRGFLGIDLFGQSQVWRRLPDSKMEEVANLIPNQTGATAGPARAPAPATPPAKGAPAPQPGAPPKR